MNVSHERDSNVNILPTISYGPVLEITKQDFFQEAKNLIAQHYEKINDNKVQGSSINVFRNKHQKPKSGKFLPLEIKKKETLDVAQERQTAHRHTCFPRDVSKGDHSEAPPQPPSFKEPHIFNVKEKFMGSIDLIAKEQVKLCKIVTNIESVGKQMEKEKQRYHGKSRMLDSYAVPITKFGLHAQYMTSPLMGLLKGHGKSHCVSVASSDSFKMWRHILHSNLNEGSLIIIMQQEKRYKKLLQGPLMLQENIQERKLGRGLPAKGWGSALTGEVVVVASESREVHYVPGPELVHSLWGSGRQPSGLHVNLSQRQAHRHAGRAGGMGLLLRVTGPERLVSPLGEDSTYSVPDLAVTVQRVEQSSRRGRASRSARSAASRGCTCQRFLAKVAELLTALQTVSDFRGGEHAPVLSKWIVVDEDIEKEVDLPMQHPRYGEKGFVKKEKLVFKPEPEPQQRVQPSPLKMDKLDSKVKRIGPHIEIFQVFRKRNKLIFTKKVIRMITVMQAHIRGWLERKRLRRIVIKALYHGRNLRAVINIYCRLIHRVKYRLGLWRTRQIINFAELEEWMDRKKFYETMFAKREDWQGLQKSELLKYFNDCGHFPIQQQIDHVWNLVHREDHEKYSEIIKKPNAIEMLFTLYPPQGAHVQNNMRLRSTWLRPIVDGEEGYKYIVSGHPVLKRANIRIVGRLVATYMRERKMRQQQAF
ncbi:IQ domain-containing protein M [Phyllostomus discolor]|uniref:IQ domain-containing protein M n=1 Tax=Phyllostomus discolor TaxID=89673 RepID=A0A7E6EGC6_9CHIR|nr:IQ domain-containing protein M [Phyllostomus discolor]